jgi:hypothetical protein
MGYATQEQATAIFDAIKERDEDRQARLPNTIAALDQASVARERLRTLGWRDGIYCPKDGTAFALIEWGSTGIHSGHYMGKWPEGHIYSGDFLVQPQAVMWKAIDDLTADENAGLARSDADTVAFMERQFQSFSNMGEA